MAPLLMMSNAAGLVLISSFNNEPLLAHTGTCQKGKVNLQQILTSILLFTHGLQWSTVNTKLAAGLINSNSTEQLWEQPAYF